MTENKEKVVPFLMKRFYCDICKDTPLHEHGYIVLKGKIIGEYRECLHCRKKTVKYNADVVVI